MAGLSPRWINESDNTAIGGCSFMIHVRQAPDDCLGMSETVTDQQWRERAASEKAYLLGARRLIGWPCPRVNHENGAESAFMRRLALFGRRRWIERSRDGRWSELSKAQSSAPRATANSCFCLKGGAPVSWVQREGRAGRCGEMAG